MYNLLTRLSTVCNLRPCPQCVKHLCMKNSTSVIHTMNGESTKCYTFLYKKFGKYYNYLKVL